MGGGVGDLSIVTQKKKKKQNKIPPAREMSIFNDHRRCLDLLDGDDEEKRQLVKDNIKNIKITFFIEGK